MGFELRVSRPLFDVSLIICVSVSLSGTDTGNQAKPFLVSFNRFLWLLVIDKSVHETNRHVVVYRTVQPRHAFIKLTSR